MDIGLRVITHLPLTELWRGDGFRTSLRMQELAAEQIIAFLRTGQVHFAIADVGLAPQWVPLHDCYTFWKHEVQPHLAAPDSQLVLERFPQGYCYTASTWRNSETSVPIIVLEKHH